MRVAILTNEFPPHIYGGAGVHVEYLTRELVGLNGVDVDVYCFGDQNLLEGNLTVRGVEAGPASKVQDPRHAKIFGTLSRNLRTAGLVHGADIVHCHTWYSHWAGCLVKQLTGAKLVLTTHSLEPHRPWKVEQLGTAYQLSAWLERTAYKNADGVVAVSPSMKSDVHALYGVSHDRIRVIPNGIDPDEYRPTFDKGVLEKYGVDATVPFVLFVGRITRQKGIIHIVDAMEYLHPGIQVVLAAGAPDTPDIEREMTRRVQAARKRSDRKIVWISDMLPRADIIALYTHAAVFACPSVYEPFGIINLEAMACETAVVASNVGGIPTVVKDGETGILVPVDTDGQKPRDAGAFARSLADGINQLMADPTKRAAFGKNGRERVLKKFSWRAIATQTLAYYESLISTSHSRSKTSPRCVSGTL